MGKQKQKIYNPDPKNRIKSNNWQFWAIIALPVIYAVVFAYIPMAGILIAFEDYSPRGGIFGSDWVGLKWIPAVPDFHLKCQSHQEYLNPWCIFPDRKLSPSDSSGHRPE